MGRAEDFRGNQLIFRRTKGEISRNRHEGGGGGVRESHQKLSGGITSMKCHSTGGWAKSSLV